MSRIDNSWYDELGDAWWDPQGPVAALHEVNPTRVDYVRGVIAGVGGAPPPQVLDLGCGGGLLAEALARSGMTVVGLDPSLPSLRAALRHAGRGSRLRYVGGAGERLPFGDAAFDAIVAVDSLEHVSHLAEVLDECVRVLRPGGRFVFDTINRTWLARVVWIWAAQDLLRIAPAHTHTYDAFVRPAELRSGLESRGMRWRELRGLSFRRHPLRAGWSYLRSRRAGGFRLSADTRLSYVGYAEKPEAG